MRPRRYVLGKVNEVTVTNMAACEGEVLVILGIVNNHVTRKVHERRDDY